MSEPMTLADHVAALEQAYGGAFEREPMADAVVVRLRHPSGEVIAASGATTADAVAALDRRVAAFLPLLTV